MNVWPIIVGFLLGLINYFIYPFIHLMVLHGGANEIPYNILHLLLMTTALFLITYGFTGIIAACLVTTVWLVYYTIARLKNEYFEWRIK